MSEWKPIETAPKDGTVFLSLNHDLEVWVARYTDDPKPRITFRTNRLHEPRAFRVHEIDGKRLLEEDLEFAKKNEQWRSAWSIWSRGYDFKPTHWMPLPTPPEVK